MLVNSVANVVSSVKPFIGQDLQLVYHVYTDLTLTADENIAGWTLTWTLFDLVTDAAAVLTKTTASGITLATPLATVSLTAANMSTLSMLKQYGMQLWRSDSGNTYPLTGVSQFTPQPKPPLT